MMKRSTVTVLVAVIVFWGGVVSAVDKVANTVHDLSAFGGTATITMYRHDTDEICVFCHTPHGANSTVSLLWNRASNPATGYYTMYTGNTPWTNAIDAGRTLNQESLLCMSCHDGSLALSTVLNTPHTDQAQPISFFTGDSTSLKLADRVVRPGPQIGDALAANGTSNQGVTNELSDDHPVSMPYMATAGVEEYGYRPASAGTGPFPNVVVNTGGELPLFSHGPDLTVECATCHSVHDNSKGSFLRFANDASVMCYTCHVK